MQLLIKVQVLGLRGQILSLGKFGVSGLGDPPT